MQCWSHTDLVKFWHRARCWFLQKRQANSDSVTFWRRARLWAGCPAGCVPPGQQPHGRGQVCAEGTRRDRATPRQCSAVWPLRHPRHGVPLWGGRGWVIIAQLIWRHSLLLGCRVVVCGLDVRPFTALVGAVVSSRRVWVHSSDPLLCGKLVVETMAGTMAWRLVPVSAVWRTS